MKKALLVNENRLDEIAYLKTLVADKNQALKDALIVLAVLKIGIKRKKYAEITSNFQDSIIAAHDKVLDALDDVRNQTAHATITPWDHIFIQRWNKWFRKSEAEAKAAYKKEH